MKQIFVDPTSKNCMFSSLEPQGSFLFHRFGKREISEEHLDIDLLTNYIKLNNIEQLILESVFGDPYEYSNIEDLLSYCQKQNINVVCISNGCSQNLKISEKFNVYNIFKLYGFTETFDKVCPGNDFKSLLDNLKFCNKIQYNVYKQNLIDLDNLQNLDIEIEYKEGPLVHTNINHVISEDGEWYHDINGLDEYNVDNLNYQELSRLPKDSTFVQSMEGYHLLKIYTKSPNETNILNSNIYKIKLTKKLPEQISISYKGHIFDSIEERNIITNTYLNDWKLDMFNTAFDYDKFIVSIMSKFANSDKLSI